jgi:exosortase/archaeosortase family protein
MIYEKKSRKKLLKILIFVIKLDLFLIPLFFLLQANLSYEPLQNFLATFITKTLNFFGYKATVDGHYITATFRESIEVIDINMDCTGWKSAYMLLALAVATPFSWKKRLKFLILSIPVIFIINYVRIVSTIAYTQKFGIQYLEVVHNLLWREGLVLAVLAIWILWLWTPKKGIKLLIS